MSPADRPAGELDPAATDITFSWNDYFATNQATTWLGEHGNQSARTYLIQVDTEPSFSAPLLDAAEVDQTTYTAPAGLYPEGTLYWRVQALDYGRIGLPWSATASLTKSSPAVAPTSPANGAVVAGTVPFTWAPQAFASTYTLEVYKNNDAAFSHLEPRVQRDGEDDGVRVEHHAAGQRLALHLARPAHGCQRQRRTVVTDEAAFLAGCAPQLLGPSNGSWQKAAGPLFEWSEVPGAASYALEIRDNISGLISVPTTATAYALTTAFGTAKYTWRVIAQDAAGQVLGTSADRAFQVDATAPPHEPRHPDGFDDILHPRRR